MIVIIASIPVIAFLGWLCTKLETYQVAIGTYLVMFSSGFLVSANMSNPYSWGYKLGYITTLTVDTGNYIVILTMLTQNLLPGSRGILMNFLITIECVCMMGVSSGIPAI